LVPSYLGNRKKVPQIWWNISASNFSEELNGNKRLSGAIAPQQVNKSSSSTNFTAIKFYLKTIVDIQN
jgi:hypothetical protein